MKSENYKATNTREIRLARPASTYWRVTFDHPPLNIFGPETIPQLNEVITALETDEQVKSCCFRQFRGWIFPHALRFSGEA
jgi:enoyl-CoA hydratase/carnithine racemase